MNILIVFGRWVNIEELKEALILLCSPGLMWIKKIMSMAIDLHLVFVVIMVGVLSTVFSLFMLNVVAIVVLAPQVMGMAGIAGIDSQPLVLMAAVCAVISAILPTNQVNAFLMSSGGYRNADYIKARVE
jgi:di/tricarboxylate transporter